MGLQIIRPEKLAHVKKSKCWKKLGFPLPKNYHKVAWFFSFFTQNQNFLESVFVKRFSKFEKNPKSWLVCLETSLLTKGSCICLFKKHLHNKKQVQSSALFLKYMVGILQPRGTRLHKTKIKPDFVCCM